MCVEAVCPTSSSACLLCAFEWGWGEMFSADESSLFFYQLSPGLCFNISRILFRTKTITTEEVLYTMQV